MRPLLSIENLKVGLKDQSGIEAGTILRGIDLTIHEGESLALVGESGCGKSMTALSIIHLLPSPPMEMVSGLIRFKGRNSADFSELDWRNIRGKEIGVVFQDPLTSLNPVLRIGHQIEEMIQLHMDLAPDLRSEKVLELLRDVGLSDVERIFRQYPHQLSGGMCQRVMIAMAIACGPSLLIADEPTTALDVTVQIQILDLLFGMKEKHKLALLFITHDLRLVRGYADRVAVLYAGQVVEEGSPEELFDHPQHPYTEGLIESLPGNSHKGRPLLNIGGKVPSPFDVVKGCVFSERCPRVQQNCRLEEPSLIARRKGHTARCYYPSNK